MSEVNLREKQILIREAQKTRVAYLSQDAGKALAVWLSQRDPAKERRIVAAQIGNGLAIRTERESLFRVGLFTNRLLLAGIVSEIMIFLALCYVPFLQRTFGTAPLEGRDLLFLLIFPPIMLGADELRKARGRRRSRRAAGVR